MQTNKKILQLKTIDYIMALLCMVSTVFLVYIDNTLYKINVVIFCILILLSRFFFYNNSKLIIDKFNLSWLCFFAWSCISILWARYEVRIDLLITILFIGIINICISNYIKKENQLLVFMDSVIVAAAILELYIISYYGWNNLMNTRMDNDILNSNRAGITFSYAVSISLFMFFKKKKLVYIIGVLFLGVGVFITGSKAGIINMIIIISIFMCFKDGENSLKNIRNLAILALLLGIVYYLVFNVEFFYNVIGIRLISFMDAMLKSQSDTSTNTRLKMITFGLQNFIKNPVLGYGLDNYKSMSAFQTYSHSNLIEIMFNLGIVGTVFFYRMYYLMVKLLFKFKNMDNTWKAFIIGWLIGEGFINFVGVYYNEFVDIGLCFLLYLYLERIAKNNNHLIEKI